MIKPILFKYFLSLSATNLIIKFKSIDIVYKKFII